MQLQDRSFKNIKKVTLVEWEYCEEGTWKLMKPNTSSKVEEMDRDYRESRYSCRNTVNFTQEDIPLLEEYKIEIVTKQVEVPQRQSFLSYFVKPTQKFEIVSEKYLVNIKRKQRFNILNDYYVETQRK